jgi:D-glycero-D-manno-heptose 1,7-bisphosphate phosphatase
MKSRKFTIFLDADGVLWPDQGSGGIFSGMESAKQNLSNLISNFPNREDIFIGIVTNQTLAARGEIKFDVFHRYVNSFFNELINQNLIDDFRVCFHHPNASFKPLKALNCLGRKPQPGMLLDLLESHKLSSNYASIVGDRITDILAGDRAKIENRILLFGTSMLDFNVSNSIEMQENYVSFKVARDLSESILIIQKFVCND